MTHYVPKFDLFPFGQRDDSPYRERWRGAALTNHCSTKSIQPTHAANCASNVSTLIGPNSR
jgi:hypothetical protein